MEWRAEEECRRGSPASSFAAAAAAFHSRLWDACEPGKYRGFCRPLVQAVGAEQEYGPSPLLLCRLFSFEKKSEYHYGVLWYFEIYFLIYYFLRYVYIVLEIYSKYFGDIFVKISFLFFEIYCV